MLDRTPQLKHILKLFCLTQLKIVCLSQKLLKSMLVDVKFTTSKIKVSDFLNPMENSLFSSLFLIFIR